MDGGNAIFAGTKNCHHTGFKIFTSYKLHTGSVQIVLCTIPYGRSRTPVLHDTSTSCTSSTNSTAMDGGNAIFAGAKNCHHTGFKSFSTSNRLVVALLSIGGRQLYTKLN